MKCSYILGVVVLVALLSVVGFGVSYDTSMTTFPMGTGRCLEMKVVSEVPGTSLQVHICNVHINWGAAPFFYPTYSPGVGYGYRLMTPLYDKFIWENL